MNRFELLEGLKNAFGVKARVLGAWTKNDGAEITAIGDSDVTVDGIDGKPAVGMSGALTLRSKEGVSGKEIRMFMIAYLEFLDGVAAIKKGAVFYVLDFGDPAKEIAYWQNGVPGPRVIQAPEAIRAALVGYLEGIIGTSPTGLTGTVIDYVIDHPGESFKSFEIRLHLSDSGVTKKQSVVARLTGSDPYKFEIDTVG